MKTARNYSAALCLAVVACGSTSENQNTIRPDDDAGDAPSAPDSVVPDVVEVGPPDTATDEASDSGCELPDSAACTPPRDITAEVICRGDAGMTCEWPLPDDLAHRTDRLNVDRYHCGDPTSRVHLPLVTDAAECETVGNGWYVVTASTPRALGICSDLWQDVVASDDRLFVVPGCS
jgi:hypothetical protein